MITAAYLLIAQAAMVGPPDIVQIPEDSYTEVRAEFPGVDPDDFFRRYELDPVGDRAQLQTGLDVLWNGGPGVYIRIDPQDPDAAEFMVVTPE